MRATSVPAVLAHHAVERLLRLRLGVVVAPVRLISNDELFISNRPGVAAAPGRGSAATPRLHLCTPLGLSASSLSVSPARVDAGAAREHVRADAEEHLR